MLKADLKQLPHEESKTLFDKLEQSEKSEDMPEVPDEKYDTKGARGQKVLPQSRIGGKRNFKTTAGGPKPQSAKVTKPH